MNSVARRDTALEHEEKEVVIDVCSTGDISLVQTVDAVIGVTARLGTIKAVCKTTE
jgi:hypothetical protein